MATWVWIKKHMGIVAAAIGFALLAMVFFLVNDKKGLAKLREERAKKLEDRLDDIREETKELQESTEERVDNTLQADATFRATEERLDALGDSVAEERTESSENHEARLAQIREASGFDDVRFRK